MIWKANTAFTVLSFLAVVSALPKHGQDDNYNPSSSSSPSGSAMSGYPTMAPPPGYSVSGSGGYDDHKSHTKSSSKLSSMPQSGSATSSASSVSSSSSTSPTSSSSSSAAPTPTYVPPSISLDSVTGNKKIRSQKYKELTKRLPKILERAVEISIHSWELGTLTETLLEVYYPTWAPFEWTYDNFIDLKPVPKNVLIIGKASLYATPWQGSPSSLGVEGKDIGRYLDPSTSPVPLNSSYTLVGGDGALGDPAALGVSTQLLGLFAQNKEVRNDFQLRSGDDYAWALGNQLAHMKAGATSENGTISQREGNFELWSDMGFMIPPLYSYVGLMASNSTHLVFALKQWLLESSALLDTTKDIWRHINAWDARLWATGNGWMTLGASRNLAAAKHLNADPAIVGQSIKDTESTLAKAFTALFNVQDKDGLIPNYMFETNATLARGDAAGTAGIVTAYYRFAVLSPEQAPRNLDAKVERAFDALVDLVDKDNWLQHVVDPMGTNGWIVTLDPKLHSPEGQSFLGMMWAARTAAGF